MAAGPGGEIAEHEAKSSANDADEQALHQEDAADLLGLDAEAHHDGDVAGLLHHHHGEGDKNVERGYDDVCPQYLSLHCGDKIVHRMIRKCQLQEEPV